MDSVQPDFRSTENDHRTSPPGNRNEAREHIKMALTMGFIRFTAGLHQAPGGQTDHIPRRGNQQPRGDLANQKYDR